MQQLYMTPARKVIMWYLLIVNTFLRARFHFRIFADNSNSIENPFA